MTEKRFHLVKCYNEQWGIVDTSLEEIDQLVLITTSKSGTGYIVDVLNEQHEENEEIGTALDNMVTFKNKYRDKYNEVKKENEQLKSILLDMLETSMQTKTVRDVYCKGILELFDKANSLNQAREMIKEHLE